MSKVSNKIFAFQKLNFIVVYTIWPQYVKNVFLENMPKKSWYFLETTVLRLVNSFVGLLS